MKNKSSFLSSIIFLVILFSELLVLHANARLIKVTGAASSLGFPPEAIVAPLRAYDIYNYAMQGFNERQGFLLEKDLEVDGGFIPANTLIDSHLLFLKFNPSIMPIDTLRHDSVEWTFSGTILGVMSDTDGSLEASSSPFLGNISTNYPGQIGYRGFELDTPDSYHIVGNGNILRVSMEHYPTNYEGDWIRVITVSEPNPCFPEPTSPSDELVTLINQWRIRQGLTPLAPDSRLENAAFMFSEDRATNNFCSHTGSDSSTYIERIVTQDYSGEPFGEAIACGPSTAQEVFDLWLDSQEYRDVLSGTTFKHIGVGFYNNEWTVDLGSAHSRPTCDSYQICGNGIIDIFEECDDGNTDNTDACLDTCVEATCGDGFCRYNFFENVMNCPEDCDPKCGDYICGPGEDIANCGYDCLPGCGDFICDFGGDFLETPDSCRRDLQVRMDLTVLMIVERQYVAMVCVVFMRTYGTALKIVENMNQYVVITSAVLVRT
jgi:hypothetical protein